MLQILTSDFNSEFPTADFIFVPNNLFHRHVWFECRANTAIFRIFCCHFWRVVSLSAEKAQQSRGCVENRFPFLFCCAPSFCLLHHHSSPLICCPTIGGAILALSILPLSRSVISTTSSCPKREFPTLLFWVLALCVGKLRE